MTWLTDLEYLCHKWLWICSFYCNHNPVLSSFMIYHWVCNKSNTKGDTCEARTVYPSGAPGVRVARSLVFCVMFCISSFVLFHFFFWPFYCLSFFDFTASDYPFGIFKLFFITGSDQYLPKKYPTNEQWKYVSLCT